MRVLPYIRKVLEIYAGGDQGHLSEVLYRDIGFDPSAREIEVDALISAIERQSVSIAKVLAGGRMAPDELASQIESCVGQLQENIKLAGEVWAEVPAIDVRVPTKSDLIEIGIMHLVLERLESGIDRISRLDLLSIVLPERLRQLQTMFSEAHFNYLLGNRTAVSIMCRALLEEALKDKVPGNVTIDGDKKTLDDRLEEAKAKGWLDDERIACAREVVRAGNLAVHDSSKLSRYSDLKIEEILINTRKILTDLYSRPGLPLC